MIERFMATLAESFRAFRKLIKRLAGDDDDDDDRACPA